MPFDSRPVRLTGSTVVDEDSRHRAQNTSFLPFAELAYSLGRLGKLHIAHDDRLREPSVVDLTLIAGFGSQVIQLHGVMIPCSYFRRSENTRASGVLGRVGQG